MGYDCAGNDRRVGGRVNRLPNKRHDGRVRRVKYKGHGRRVNSVSKKGHDGSVRNHFQCFQCVNVGRDELLKI